MAKRQTKNNIMPWIAVLAWMGFIFLLSHQPVGETDTLSSSLTGKIRRTIKHIFPSVSLDMATLHRLIQMGLIVFAFLIFIFIIVYALRFPKRKGMVATLLPWLAILGWMAIFFTLNNQPGDQLSDLSTNITNTIHHIYQMIFPSLTHDENTLHHLIRKSAHFFEYMLLGVLILHALRGQLLKGAVIAIFLSVFYAVTDEIHQLFVPGRGGELRDVLIDGLGATTGVVIYLVLYVLIKLAFGKRK